MYDNVPFPLSVDTFVSQTDFDVTITNLGNGAERRTVNWDDGLYRFDAMVGIRSLADLRAVYQFHLLRRGTGRSFPVRDLLDCQATWDGSNMAFATGTNTAGPFQLTKTYSDAGNNWVREITKPEQGTIKIYVNAVLQVEGVAYTIDYLTGLVTFLSGHFPAVDAIIEWTGRFWVPVRFNDRMLPIQDIFMNMKQDTDGAWILPVNATANLPQILMIEDRTA